MATRLSRRTIARYVAERIQADDSTVLASLAAFLIESRRTGEADLIVRDIEVALAANGVVVADIVTASTLSAALKATLQAHIEAVADANEVHVRTHVDESQIGGVRIATPGAEFDATVRRQLTKLQAMKV